MKRIERTAVFVCLKYTGAVHEIINTSVIVMLLESYSKVKIYASPEMCLNIKKQLRSLGYETDSVVFVYRHYLQFKRGMIKTIIDAFRLCSISLRNVCPRCDMFFGTVNYSFVPVGNLISRFTRQRQFHICHDEVRFLLSAKPQKGYREWKSRLYAMNEINYCDNFKYIVLGDSIKRNLKGVVSDNTYNHILSIIHPYYSLSRNCNCKREIKRDHIRIGVVGEIRNDELYKNILKTNDILQDYESVYIYIISKNQNYDFSACSHIVLNNPDNRYLSREEYDMMVQDLDYIYFPYTKESYKYGASGAVFEAIVKCIPFIAYANDYFKMIIEKFGAVGYLYETEEEMKIVIEQISKCEIVYDMKNADIAKNYLDPRNYYAEFQNKLDL